MRSGLGGSGFMGVVSGHALEDSAWVGLGASGAACWCVGSGWVESPRGLYPAPGGR